jgi:hypothetical protein
MGIAEIEPKWNECRINRGDHGGVWIRHGIQQLTADSVVLFHVDEE